MLHPCDPDDWDYELGAWVETFNVGYWGVWGNGTAPDASDDCVIIGGGTDRNSAPAWYAKIPMQK